ncbi:MAG: hypothetical protein ABI841_08170 [Chloroflexota bacterium]
MADLKPTPRETMVAGVVLVGLAVAIAAVAAVALLRPNGIIGAKVSYDESRLHTDRSEPLTFNVVEFESGGDFFNEDRPDRLTVAVTGCYFVQAQITVLGSDYNLAGTPEGGNPESPDFIIEIRKNGDPDEFVAADYLSDEDGHQALLNHTGSVECFQRGEYIQLFVTGNRVIESNWPDSDGSVSPVLYMVYVGSLP